MKTLLTASFCCGATLCAFVLSGCAGKSSSGQLQEQAQTLVSSTATAQMAAGAWLKEQVPSSFAHRTLQTVQQDIAKQAKDSSQNSDTKEPLPTQRITTILKTMTQAVTHDDRPRMQRSVSELTAEQSALGDWAKRHGIELEGVGDDAQKQKDTNH